MYQQFEQLLKNIIFNAIGRHNQIKVFLFGSRAKGNARSRSDIDIALLSDQPLPLLISQLKEKIEESTIPYQVDVVDLSTVSPTFRKKVLTEGKPWID